tara:strand:+ start:648 stop:1262 length:615 start_codon:yes stop_codon:yes gene_type:complete
MAITDGLSIGCSDLQASGGIQRVFIREWNSTGSPDQIALGVGTITSIADSGGTNSTWGVFESKIETPAITVSGTSEKNVNTYECNLTFMLPKMDLTKRNRIQEFAGKCLMVMAEDTNGTYFVLGVSDVLTGGDGGLDIPVASHIGTRPQTFARLASVEGGSGAAFSDENGLTVTITCSQYELPRNYVNATAPDIAADGLSAEIV